jgi:ABC-2 type transport system ATP-binding protein
VPGGLAGAAARQRARSRGVRGSAVRLDGVGKRYGVRQPWIVRDVAADVAAGQLIRLEGRNGSGKSTLLRVAAGITNPSAGRVTGRPHTGYVPERFPGSLAFSGREYLMHMGRIHGLRGPSVSAAVDEWLDRLGAADYAGSPLRTLSKGMCQKVAIAQALLPRPGLLVLDEAWTGLDQAARGALDTAVAELLADGGTVMFVDHHQARLAGRVTQRWMLSDGQVRMLDGPGGAVPGGAVPGGAVPGGAVPGGAAPGGVRRGATMLIELSGLDAESIPQVCELTGVIAVHPASGAGADSPGAVQVVAEAAESDRLLRQLLGWDDVHVRSVRPGPGGGLEEPGAAR